MVSNVCLGDVATEVRETTKNSTGMPVVGLEHLVPGEIELSQWAEDSDNTFTKVFRKGQVLFGRRRAYQKKASVATIDGVCSGYITVIMAREEKLLPELLPFIVNDDRFFDFAMEKSAGSLSPRVKWAQLAEYSFELPESVKKQRELASLLWAIERSRKAYKVLEKQADDLVKSQFVEVFGESKAYGSPTTVADVCINTMIGPFGSALHINETTEEGEIFVLGTDNAVDNVFNVYKKRYIDLKKYESLKKYTVKPKDIIVSMMGTIGRTAIIPDDFGTAIISSHLCCLTPDPEKVRTEFLNAILQLHDGVLKQINDQKKGTIMSGLNLKIINGLSFCLPRLDEQDRFISFLHQTDKSKLAIRQALESLEKSRNTIMKSIFG